MCPLSIFGSLHQIGSLADQKGFCSYYIKASLTCPSDHWSHSDPGRTVVAESVWRCHLIPCFLFVARRIVENLFIWMVSLVKVHFIRVMCDLNTKTNIISKQLYKLANSPRTHFPSWCGRKYRLFHETYPVLILLWSVSLDRPPPFRAWFLIHNRIITLKGCRESLVILFIKCFTEFLEYGGLAVSG